jgi:D-alanyl-D-alanine carboxypeptidase
MSGPSSIRRSAIALVFALGMLVGCSSSSVSVAPATTTSATTTAATTTAATTAPSTSTTADTTTTTTATTTTVNTSTTATAAAVAAPRLSVASYAVYDATSQRWLADFHADEPHAVGSIMKLVTAYVVMRAGQPTKSVTVPPMKLDPSESAIGLYPGEHLSRAVLLRGMLIVSANDAARALAVDVGGSTAAFVSMMNAAAQQLGLHHTVAANPIGLDAAGAHSSARDVVSIASVLMGDATFRSTVARRSATLHGRTLPTTNGLLRSYPGADGIKTGHTSAAGYCVVASAVRHGRRIIVAVVGAPTDAARVQAATKLLDWAFAHT